MKFHSCNKAGGMAGRTPIKKIPPDMFPFRDRVCFCKLVNRCKQSKRDSQPLASGKVEELAQVGGRAAGPVGRVQRPHRGERPQADTRKVVS